MEKSILFFAVTFLASIVGAISGIGGGIIIKPALELASDLDAKAISFLSGSAVLTMALVSIIIGRKQAVKLEYRRGTMLGIGAAIGGVAGKAAMDWIAGYFNDTALGNTQSVVLCVMVSLLFVYCLLEKRMRRKNITNSAVCIALGGAMGLASSFLGIGGGPLNLAILRFFFSMDSRRAALHSLYIIVFSQSANLLLTVLLGEQFSSHLLVLLPATILGGAFGAALGRAFSKKMGSHLVNRLYMGILVFVFFLSIGNLR